MTKQLKTTPKEKEGLVMQKSKELKQRIFYGLVIAGIALIAIYRGGGLFNGFAAAIAVVMFYEFHRMVKNRNDVNRPLWFTIKLFYIVIPVLSFVLLRAYNYDAAMWLVLTIAAADIGGFAIGKLLGKHKLAPKISPNKTWEGLAGCCIFAGIVSYCYTLLPSFIIIGAFIGLISQAGDLTESLIKRYFGVKDSSGLIPGHGGIMDRLDGYLYAAPLALLWQLNGVLGFV